MAVPLSGELSLGKVRQEFHNDNYFSGPYTSNATNLEEASTGAYGSINFANSLNRRPDTQAPHALSEFYGYDHDKTVNNGGASKSDIRLKENINLIGYSKLNIPIYEFNYIGKSKRYQGTMAQDLLNMNLHDAVILDKDGYYNVLYNKIDVEFKQLEIA